MLAALILAASATALGAILAARALEARHWRRSLTAYEFRLPAEVDESAVVSWLGGVAAITHRARWSALPLPPVACEVVASTAGIAHYLLVSGQNASPVLSALRSALPGTRITEAPDHLSRRPRVSFAAEATLTSRTRPLAYERNAATSTTLLASLQPQAAGTTVILQWLVTSAGTPPPVKQPPSSSTQRPLAWLVEGEAPVDAEAVRQERLKYRDPVLQAVLRVGVAAPRRGTAVAVFGNTWGHLQGLNAPGVRLVRRYLPSALVSRWLTAIRLPLLRWPLLLNSRELAGLSGLPLMEVQLPGLRLGVARQLPPPTALPRRGLVLANSNYPGMTDRPLALAVSDRPATPT